jgi:hypothetical protein
MDEQTYGYSPLNPLSLTQGDARGYGLGYEFSNFQSRGSAEAILRHTREFQFEPGKLDQLLAEMNRIDSTLSLCYTFGRR